MSPLDWTMEYPMRDIEPLFYRSFLFWRLFYVLFETLQNFRICVIHVLGVAEFKSVFGEGVHPIPELIVAEVFVYMLFVFDNFDITIWTIGIKPKHVRSALPKLQWNKIETHPTLDNDRCMIDLF